MGIYSYIWAGAFLVFVITEAATAGLTTIWFAAGSLVSFILSLFDVPLVIQIVVFFVLSTALLLITRPLVKKYVNKKTESTNFDRIVGRTAVVTEAIDDIKGTGRIIVSGQDWAAVSENGGNIGAGENVIIEKIEGVKAVVKKAND